MSLGFLLQCDQTPKGLWSSFSQSGNEFFVPYFVDLRPLGKPFAVSKFLVSNRLYGAYLGQVARKKMLYDSDDRFNQPDQPAVGMTYNDAEDFCQWLGRVLELKVQLPEASVWEEIARAGRDSEFSTASGECEFKDANVELRYGKTSRVDQFSPNGFGVHDMTGNVLEWTSSAPSLDQMRPEYGAMPARTPMELSKNRIVKGGCWSFSRENSKISANVILGKFSNYYTTGFRPIIDFGGNLAN